MNIWNKVAEPPATALKKIGGGKLSGKTDINPQWRLKALTQAFGPCGDGWKYTIDKLWHETGPDGRVMAFALVSLYYKQNQQWSEAIPGIGGNMMADIEKGNLVSSDECYKMAVTDALSVACKALGVASAIYEGNWDGSKYQRHSLIPEAQEPVKPIKKVEAVKPTPAPQKTVPSAPEAVVYNPETMEPVPETPKPKTRESLRELSKVLRYTGRTTGQAMLEAINEAGYPCTSSEELTDTQAAELIEHFLKEVR